MRALSLAVLGLAVGTVPALAFDCTALTGTVIPKSAIGLPTSGAVVESASLVADPRNGTYCKLLGGIKPVDPTAPDIKFQVNLPERWNGKAVQLGGGGSDGILVTGERLDWTAPDTPQPIKRGYVTFGSDSGHQGAGSDVFALNAEAFDNFKGDQIKKTHDVAVALILRAYHKRPRLTYFAGSSQGGHEALLAVKRWPGDYDGAIAVHAFYNPAAMFVDWLLLQRTILLKPGAWISPAKLALVSAKVLDSCDGLDGLRDGVIGNVEACRTTFDIAPLRCSSGADTGVDCLSDAQIATFHLLAGPVELGMTLSGVDTIAATPLLESATAPDTNSVFLDAAAPTIPPKLTRSADQIVRYVLMQDPNFDSMTFDPTAHVPRLRQLSQEMDVVASDLSAFHKRDGKLLLMHGTSDFVVPPGNSVAFFEQLHKIYGADLVKFARFYMAPGFGHGNGNFRVGWDSLGALDNWVSKGNPPGLQVATDTNTATLGRTRPLCEYPAYPRYNGSGDVNQAASFTCTMP